MPHRAPHSRRLTTVRCTVQSPESTAPLGGARGDEVHVREGEVRHGDDRLEERDRRVGGAHDNDARVVDDLGLREQLARQEVERALGRLVGAAEGREGDGGRGGGSAMGGEV